MLGDVTLPPLQTYHAPPAAQHGILQNLFQDAQDYAVGLGPGIGHLIGAIGHDAWGAVNFRNSGYELPAIGQAIVNDYKHVYGPAFDGNFGLTAQRVKDHPLGPILDVLSLVTMGAGAVGKVGKIAATVGRADSLAARMGAKAAGYGRVANTPELMKGLAPEILSDTGAGLVTHPAYIGKDGAFLSEGSRLPHLFQDDPAAHLSDHHILESAKAAGEILQNKQGDLYQQIRREVSPINGGKPLTLDHHTNPYRRLVGDAYAKVGARFPNASIVGLGSRVAKQETRLLNSRMIAESRKHITPIIEKHFKNPAEQKFAHDVTLAVQEGVHPEHQISGYNKQLENIASAENIGPKQHAKDLNSLRKIQSSPESQIKYHADAQAKAQSLVDKHDFYAKMSEKNLTKILERHALKDPKILNKKIYSNILLKDHSWKLKKVISYENRGGAKIPQVGPYVDKLKSVASKHESLANLAKSAKKNPSSIDTRVEQSRLAHWQSLPENAATATASIRHRLSILQDPKMHSVLEVMDLERSLKDAGITPDASHLAKSLEGLSPKDHAFVDKFIHNNGIGKLHEIFANLHELETQGTTANYGRIDAVKNLGKKRSGMTKDELANYEADARRVGPAVAFNKLNNVDLSHMSEADALAHQFAQQSTFLKSLGYRVKTGEVTPVIRSHRAELAADAKRQLIYSKDPNRKIVHQTTYFNVQHALDHWDIHEAALTYHRSLATISAVRTVRTLMSHMKPMTAEEASAAKGWVPFSVQGQGHLAEHVRSILGFLREDAPAMFGDLTDNTDVKALEDQLSAALDTQGGKVNMIPSSVHKVLAPEVINDSKFIRKFWDNPSRWWRNWTLGLRPAWMVNNLIGNMMLLWTSQGLYGGTRSMLELMRNKDLRGTLNSHAGDLYQSGFSRSMMEQSFKDVGVKKSDSIARAKFEMVAKAQHYAGKLNPNTLAEWVINKNASWLEDPIRQSAFWAEVRKPAARLAKSTGMSIPDAAKMMLQDEGFTHHLTTKVLGDMVNFRDLSQVERTWIRRAIPFYAWISGITKHTGGLIAKDPLQADIYTQLGKIGHQDVNKTFGQHPEFFNSFMGLGKPSADGKQRTLNTLSMNPYSTVGDVVGMLQPFVPGAGGGGLQGTQNPLNSLNPLVKAPLEVATGKDLFFGGPLNELRAPKTDYTTGVTTGGDPNMNKAVLLLRRYALQYPLVRIANKATTPVGTHPLFNDTLGSQTSQYFGLPLRSTNLGEVHARAALVGTQ